MKANKILKRRQSPKAQTVEQTASSPQIQVPKLWSNLKYTKDRHQILKNIAKAAARDVSNSETNLPQSFDSEPNDLLYKGNETAQGDDKISTDHSAKIKSPQPYIRHIKMDASSESQSGKTLTGIWENDTVKSQDQRKKPKSCSPSPTETNDPLAKQIRDIHYETRKSSRVIRDSRARLLEIQKKTNLTEADVKELGERNELLLREMERFDKLTRNIQKLVAEDLEQKNRFKDNCCQNYQPVYELPVYHEMKMNHPTVLVGCNGNTPTARSKSEIDLTRKLSESYDMQEKLVADNADLEVKRYILYKELMTKDQNLETCRAQIKRLQGELKLMNRENCVLHEKLNRNSPEGDATTVNQVPRCQQDLEVSSEEEGTVPIKSTNHQELVAELEIYKNKNQELQKELADLEYEVRFIKVNMDNVKASVKSACVAGGAPKCIEQPSGGPPVPPTTKASGGPPVPPTTKASGGPPVPPTTKAYGACPPCPAPCNPNASPTPAEREVQKLTLQLQQTEENFKIKITECAIIRTEFQKQKEELEKERYMNREIRNKLRELEMRSEGLRAQANRFLGSKEQAFEQEVNLRTLTQCYREATQEVQELRALMKEQNDQLQNYRVKYLQAQQLVEEQRRQMDAMHMDNYRISEQINLEIQRVKITFQERLQELAPIPDLLRSTQMRLKDAQQCQAIAEHTVEQLARELNSAREKIHMLLHNKFKSAEKPAEKAVDEKQMALLQQKIAQLTETNASYKSDIERLKVNIMRMEENVLANEKRLQEKMNECAQLAGELDRSRDEAARSLQRANERAENIRKSMQTNLSELERQLAASRAKVKIAEKDKEQVQSRMQKQIERLNENFEQAQLRIRGLQTQVQTLKRTVSTTSDGEGHNDQQECACESVFENA